MVCRAQALSIANQQPSMAAADPPWALAKAAEKARSVSAAKMNIFARFMAAEDARVAVVLLGEFVNEGWGCAAVVCLVW